MIHFRLDVHSCPQHLERKDLHFPVVSFPQVSSNEFSLKLFF